MGVGTKLRINSRWELRDVIKVLEHHLPLEEFEVEKNVFDIRIKGSKKNRKELVKVKTDVESCHEISPGFFHIFFTFNKEKRMMSVFTNSDHVLGSCTLLSLGHNDDAIKIMRTIAEALGGLLEESDCEGTLEEIQSNFLNDNDGVAYFLKTAALEKQLSGDSENEKADLDVLKERVTLFNENRGRRGGRGR